MVQPGHEANTPWGDESEGESSSSSTTPNAAPQPIVLSGAEGLSLDAQMQGQMPSQLTPSSGVTLTGSVGTIDSGVWAPQVQIASQGSMLKGIGITCMFGVVILLVPVLMVGYAESSWEDDWKEETLDVEWDESGLNGTFQLSHAPIESCSVSIRDAERDWGPHPFQVYENCQDDTGTLVENKRMTRVEFAEGQGEVTRVTYRIINQSSGDGEFTVYPLAYEGANDSVTLHLPEASPPEIGTQSFDENLIPLIFAVNTTNWSEPCPSASSLMVLNKMGPQDYNPSFVGSPTGCDLNYTDFHYEFTFFVGLDDRENDSVSLYLPEQGNYFLGTQTINENMTPLIFPVNTNNWDENHCAQEIRIAITDQGSDWYYPDYTQWGQPPICPKMTYYIHYETTFGSIDYDTGYGEIYLDEPLEEKELEVEYWSYTEGMEFGDFVECLAPLFSFALFVVWIIQIVRAFQAGLTTQGTGMLVGIIPAFFVSLILTFVIGIILFGF